MAWVIHLVRHQLPSSLKPPGQPQGLGETIEFSGLALDPQNPNPTKPGPLQCLGRVGTFTMAPLVRKVLAPLGTH